MSVQYIFIARLKEVELELNNVLNNVYKNIRHTTNTLAFKMGGEYFGTETDHMI